MTLFESYFGSSSLITGNIFHRMTNFQYCTCNDVPDFVQNVNALELSELSNSFDGDNDGYIDQNNPKGCVESTTGELN